MTTHNVLRIETQSFVGERLPKMYSLTVSDTILWRPTLVIQVIIILRMESTSLLRNILIYELQY